MKRILFLILSLGVFLSAGCAAAEPAKDPASGNVMHTNAPREVAFEASCEALQKLGYTIETKDTDSFFVKGSYVNPWAGRAPLYARIDVRQEASETQIVYSVYQPGAIKVLDITGRYSRCADNIRKEIISILVQGDSVYKKTKQSGELSGEGTHHTKKHRLEQDPQE